MADKEHLTILEKGAYAWNDWKISREDIVADLSGADLRQANLSDITLERANLRGANLSGADLSYADLREADLRGAELIETNLFEATLNKANLSNANARCSSFLFSHCTFANFNYANLSSVRMSEASVLEADFSCADLSYADLTNADFSDSNFSNVNLSNAALWYTDLSRTNLSGANLSRANLSGVQALGTSFANANLTGACIADWQVGSSTNFRNVECGYIFRRVDEDKGQFYSRLPVNEEGFFAPGEFTQRFQILSSASETIDLTFTEGIDWQAFFDSFQEICRDQSLGRISVQGIERKNSSFVIRLTTQPDADQAKIEERIKQLYSLRLTALEAQYEGRLRLQGLQMEETRQAIAAERREKSSLTRIIATMAENQGPKYEFNAPVGSVVDTAQSGSQIYSTIHNYLPEQRQNLVDAAKEIQNLLKQLSENYTRTEVPSQAIRQIQQNPQLKERVIGALKGGGRAALEKLVDHPAISIVLAAIDGANDPT